jgi:arsenite methyltransferase
MRVAVTAIRPLDHCRAVATAEGLLDRCRFVLASADSLADIEDASVDVVTARSVLIYVKDKAEALLAFYRVLRPGGGSVCSSRSTC